MVEQASRAGDVSTEEAAKLLHVSLKFVDQLVEAGELVGAYQAQDGQRRIPRAIVSAFKEKLKASRKKGLDKMIEASERMGLYDAEVEDLRIQRKG
jgi:excisionase family DNA binding protein